MYQIKALTTNVIGILYKCMHLDGISSIQMYFQVFDSMFFQNLDFELHLCEAYVIFINLVILAPES